MKEFSSWTDVFHTSSGLNAKINVVSSISIRPWPDYNTTVTVLLATTVATI